MCVNIFWDNSNIWLVGKNVCAQKEKGLETQFRIHFANLFEFCCQGRQVSFAFLAGSVPPTTDELWTRIRELGIQIITQERGKYQNNEVAVDEIIQLKMANRILDCESPETMVLLTGDGKGYNQGIGFIPQLERAVKRNWKIEVISWGIGCNKALREFASNNGVFRELEPVYENVTFIEGFRLARPFKQ